MTNYPSVSYKSIRDGAARRRGLVPDSLATSDKASIAEFAAARLEDAWRWGAWPGWCPVERIPVVAEWSSSAAYAAGALVWNSADNLYYSAASPVSAGTEPPAAPWALAAAPITRDLDTVFTVYLADPRDNPRALRTPFLQGVAGLTMPEVSPGSYVWVHYRLSPPRVTATEWSAETAYSPGDTIYDDTTGDCWVCLVAGTNKPPATNPTLWARQVLPQALADVIACGVTSDMLSAAGQYEQSGRMDAKSKEALITAYDRALGQSPTLEL